MPSNYLQEVDDEEPGSAAAAPQPPREETPEPTPAPTAGGEGASATALYDYEAGEDNELSFPEDAVITNIVSVATLGKFLAANKLRRPSLTKTGGMANTVVALDCFQPTTPRSTTDIDADGAVSIPTITLLVKAKVLEQDSVHTKSLSKSLYFFMQTRASTNGGSAWDHPGTDISPSQSASEWKCRRCLEEA